MFLVFVLQHLKATTTPVSIVGNPVISLENVHILSSIIQIFRRLLEINNRVKLRTRTITKMLRKGKNEKKTGQVFYIQAREIPEGEPMMLGMFPVADHPAVMLFDSGASHTFINITFVIKHEIPIGETKENFYIQSLEGRLCTKEMVYQVPINLGGHIFPTTMIILKD